MLHCILGQDHTLSIVDVWVYGQNFICYNAVSVGALLDFFQEKLDAFQKLLLLLRVLVGVLKILMI